MFLVIGMVAPSPTPSIAPANAGQTDAPIDFVCPMHPDVHSSVPGHCPRCGMPLVANLPDRAEYQVMLALRPSAPRPGKTVQLVFTVQDPRTGKQVTDFQLMHERLYHLFIV